MKKLICAQEKADTRLHISRPCLPPLRYDTTKQRREASATDAETFLPHAQPFLSASETSAHTGSAGEETELPSDRRGPLKLIHQSINTYCINKVLTLVRPIRSTYSIWLRLHSSVRNDLRSRCHFGYRIRGFDSGKWGRHDNRWSNFSLDANNTRCSANDSNQGEALRINREGKTPASNLMKYLRPFKKGRGHHYTLS